MNTYIAKRGFTLIELLVVIAIIGVLSAVVVTSLRSAQLDALDARNVSNVQNIALAFQTEYDPINASYPAYNDLTTIDTTLADAHPNITVANPSASGPFCVSYELVSPDVGAEYFKAEPSGAQYVTAAEGGC